MAQYADSPQGGVEVASRLVGRYQRHNLLAVAGDAAYRRAAVRGTVCPPRHQEAPRGAMQRLSGDSAPLVAIDYAHTRMRSKTHLWRCAMRLSRAAAG